MKQSKEYFKSFNELRAIACILVFFYHTYKLVFLKNDTDSFIIHLIYFNGGNAVSFFFVLSGFLISYLLLNEIQNTDTVDVKGFYFKRIIRIWPIYYLVVLVVNVFLPLLFFMLNMKYTSVSTLSTVFYLLILPNLSRIISDFGKLGHLWSIGVEEQFYFIWAPLVKFFKYSFLKLCLSIIIIKFLLLILFQFLASNTYCNYVFLFLQQFKLEQMAIGGIGAYLIFNYKERVMRQSIFSVGGQIIISLILLLYLCLDEKVITNQFFQKLYIFIFIDCGYLLMPVVYLYTILNLSLNERAIFKLKNSFLNYLGKISYGFYIYHIFSILLVEFILLKADLAKGTFIFNALFYTLSVSLNIIVSHLSFIYFESYFLKLRPSSGPVEIESERKV